MVIPGGMRYPGLTRAFFHDMVVYGATGTPAAIKMNTFLEELVVRLKKMGVSKEDGELRSILPHIASSAFLVPVLLPHAWDSFNPQFEHTPQGWRVFIRSIVERLL